MKWKKIEPKGIKPLARHGHRGVSTKDCIYFYSGGNRKICEQFHLYKIKENKNELPLFSGIKCPGVASFGMVIYNDTVVIIFGGMVEYGYFTNDLYTLHLPTLNWKKFNNRAKDIPDQRMGHSFTLTDDDKIILFGGIANTNLYSINTPHYLNDLYILHILDTDKFKWQKLPKTSNDPCQRESHSAVFYVKGDEKFIVIFGGMNGCRLGDLWFLDLSKFIWTQCLISGIPTSPRSLHSATLVGSKMFIFGGWIESNAQESDDPLDMYETSNQLSYLDLDSLEWHHVDEKDELNPLPRAGHSMVAVDSRIYLFSGRSDYTRKTDQICDCYDDFWCLETELAEKITSIALVSATKSSLEIKWDEIDNADVYLVEIHAILAAPVDFSKIRIKSNVRVDANNQLQIVKRKSDESDQLNEKKFKLEAKIDVQKEIKSEPIIPLKTSIVQKDEKGWQTAGIFTTNSCTVDGIYAFKIDTTDINSEKCPKSIEFSQVPKVDLSVGTMYAFRVAAINILGMSEWSKMFYFSTEVPAPSIPKNCKFIPTNRGLRLAWNPNERSEKITKYFVFLATGSSIDFKEIYAGIQPTCLIQNAEIEQAFTQELNDKKMILLRITAFNSFGESLPSMWTYNIDK